MPYIMTFPATSCTIFAGLCLSAGLVVNCLCSGDKVSSDGIFTNITLGSYSLFLSGNTLIEIDTCGHTCGTH